MSTTDSTDDGEGRPLPERSIGDYRQPQHEPFECDDCGGPFVLDENEDKRCYDCGILASVDPVRAPRDDEESEWEKWQTNRRENEDYSGWYGDDRVKFVGGFLGAWSFEEDAIFQ